MAKPKKDFTIEPFKDAAHVHINDLAIAGTLSSKIEAIGGVVHCMLFRMSYILEVSISPNYDTQEVAAELDAVLGAHFKGVDNE